MARLNSAIVVLLAGFSPCIGLAQSETKPPRQYAEAVAQLDALIRHEVEDKKLPAVSIAVVDDQTLIWAKGFGHVDAAKKIPASADTVYRVGSVSKLFTDIAVMQLVEKGQLELDAPVTRYLPDFRPTSSSNKPITLRHLMAHRAGLVREPPVGNYFDSINLSLAKTVASLNETELIFSPGEKSKYSNAGIAVIGRVLEKTRGEPFPSYLRRTLLEPLGMQRSAFEPLPELRQDMAQAIMWTYHGREFAAPTFELGMAPAGSMYSTVNDLAVFLQALASKGGKMLKSESLDEMLRPQFAKPDAKTGIGLGFFIQERNGRRRIGHNGAMYGFATELAFLPEEKLGVVVAISCDCANPVAARIADEALDCLLAAKQGKPLPQRLRSEPLSVADCKLLAGRWKHETEERFFDLETWNGRVWLWPGRGGMRTEIRKAGDGFVTDDRLGFGARFRHDGGALNIGNDRFTKTDIAKPDDIPERWRGLIGEYGEDHNVLVILERNGRLFALIEWFFLYELTEESENVFRFPEFGLYHDEKLIFTREAGRTAIKVIAASVVFKRRHIDGEFGKTFRIQPVRQLDGLRKEAITATPPIEGDHLRKSDLVDLEKLDRSLQFDIRYATANNFLSTPFYASAKAYLQRPAAERLVRVHQALEKEGYGLLIFDGYRPWFVTKMFWEATPEKVRNFVANPLFGSRHNRGCAVDLTLFERKSGKPVEMVGGYDEFSDRSYPNYLGGTSLQRWHRDLLRRAMESEGFQVYEAEWWHFDYKDWREYPILNRAFEDLR